MPRKPLLFAALALSGCATSPPPMYSSGPGPVSDAEACFAVYGGRSVARHFESHEAYTARGLDLAKCSSIMEAANAAQPPTSNRASSSNTGLAVAALIGAVLGAKGKIGPVAPYSPPRPVESPPLAVDITFAWDEFYTTGGVLMWACRGQQTGRFAEEWRCNGLLKVDFTWPAKFL